MQPDQTAPDPRFSGVLIHTLTAMAGLPDSVGGALFALIAAFCGALGSVLQAREAIRAEPTDAANTTPLLLVLVRRPWWLLGIGIAGLGFVFHGIALGDATLAEVEPLLVLALVFALPLGGWLCKQPVGAREWTAALAVILGLLVFLLSADPRHGHRHPSPLWWAITGALIVASMAACVYGAHRSSAPAMRAVLLGTSAAIGLATGAVIIKAWTHVLKDQGLRGLLDWRALVLAGGGIVVLALQQRAYRAGPFAAALSPMIGLNPILASALGIVLFGERIHLDTTRTLVALVGIAVVAWGLYRLSRAPAITLEGM